jgi:hypothetical protein
MMHTALALSLGRLHSYLQDMRDPLGSGGRTMLGRAICRLCYMKVWAGLSCITLCAGLIAVLPISRAAAADVNPCSDPQLSSAMVQTTLQVQIRNVDWPSFTTAMQVTVPEAWPGTSGLFGNGLEQGRSLGCFMPVGQEDFQSAPPIVTVAAKTRKKQATVTIANTISMSDGAGANSSWSEGLWTVSKQTWGYQVTFQPHAAKSPSGYGGWSVMLVARGLNIVHPNLSPTTDDGQGSLTWVFPPSKTQPPKVTVSLTSPWQVRLNLASDRWPLRFFSDMSWALNDGMLVDLVGLLTGFWLRRRMGATDGDRRLSYILQGISCLSLLCYSYYALDDYFWTQTSSSAIWIYENTALVAVTAPYFWAAVFGVRRRGDIFRYSGFSVIVALVLYIISYFDLSPGVAMVVLALIPLLAAFVFANAGTVLWIRRFWLFGKKGGKDYLDNFGVESFGEKWVSILVSGMTVLGLCVLVQSTAAAYYAWLQSDMWGKGKLGLADWVESDLLNGAHWWIADGLQWGFGFAVIGGIFAALWAMSRSGRGVFLGPAPARVPATSQSGEPEDRGDLVLLALITSSLFIGIWGFYDEAWGFYDGIFFPLACVVAFAGLAVWGITRTLSKRDWRQRLSSETQATTGPAGPPNEPQPDIPFEFTNAANLDPPAAQHPSSTEVNKPRPADQLALGPGDTWYANGAAALRAGKYLAVIPIGFDIYITWNSGNLSVVNFLFGLQDAFGTIISIVVGWLSGLFMFGVLIPYLRGMRTPIKGALFGLIAFASFAADSGVRQALGVTPDPVFVVDGLLAVLLFAATGLLLDVQTLQERGNLKLIRQIYDLDHVRVVVTSVTTLIVVGVGLWQAIYLTGQTAEQRTQTISNTSQYVNGAARPG